MERRDRDEAVGDGRAVGALAGDEAEVVAADPVVLAAARIVVLDDRVAIAALALAGDAVAADCSVGRAGTLTLSSVSRGMPRSSTASARRAANSAAGPNSSASRATSDIAIDGTPSSVPSIAADTVPE